MKGIGKDGRVKWFNSRVFPGKYVVKKTKRIIEVYDSYEFHVACEDVLSKAKIFIEKDGFFKICKKLPEKFQIGIVRWRRPKKKEREEREELFV